MIQNQAVTSGTLLSTVRAAVRPGALRGAAEGVGVDMLRGSPGLPLRRLYAPPHHEGGRGSSQSLGAVPARSPGRGSSHAVRPVTAVRRERPCPTSLVAQVTTTLMALSGWPVYALVGGLVFAESGLLVGLVVPGETAVLLGGVLAAQHPSLCCRSSPWSSSLR